MPDAALAYIGPGAGIGLVGAVVGVLVAVGIAFVFVLTWPLRLVLRRFRGQRSCPEPMPRQAEATRATDAVTGNADSS